jgi:hypothetical protein
MKAQMEILLADLEPIYKAMWNSRERRMEEDLYKEALKDTLLGKAIRDAHGCKERTLIVNVRFMIKGYPFPDYPVGITEYEKIIRRNLLPQSPEEDYVGYAISQLGSPPSV